METNTTHLIQWQPENEPFTEAARIIVGLSFIFLICSMFILGSLLFMFVPETWFGEFSTLVKIGIVLILSPLATILYTTHNNGKTIFVHFHTLRRGKSKKPYAVKKRAAEMLYNTALKQKIC